MTTLSSSESSTPMKGVTAVPGKINQLARLEPRVSRSRDWPPQRTGEDILFRADRKVGGMARTPIGGLAFSGA
jgi:hypothetical protein